MGQMSRSLLLWIAASVVVLIGLVLWTRAEPTVGVVELRIGAQDSAEESALELSAVAHADELRNPRVDAGSATPREPIAPAVARQPIEFEVLVLRAEDDTPIAGAEVSTDYYDPRPSQVTGADGLTRWRWNGALPETLSASAPGRVRLQERLWFQAGRAIPNETMSVRWNGASQQVVVRLEMKRAIEVRLVDARGDELEPFDLGFDPQTPRGVHVALGVRCAAPGQEVEVRGAPTFVAKPASWEGLRFAWHLEVRGPEACCVHVVVGDLVLASQSIDLATREVALTVDPALWTRVAAPFVVRVLSAEDGRALVGVDATASTSNGFSCTLRTDAEGRARFTGRIVAAEFDVEAVGDGYTRARLHASRPIGDELVLRLARGRTVSGVVVEESDRPVVSARIGVYLASELGTIARPLAIAESGADGRFSLPWMPVDALVLVDLGRTEGTAFLERRNAQSPGARIVDGGREDVELVLPVVRDLHTQMWGR